MALSAAPAIDDVRARAYRVPTDRPEADGTYAWHATTIVVVGIDAGPVTGLGYTYTDARAASLVTSMLADVLRNRPLADIPAAVDAMWRAVRNIGRGGIAATAISALDNALWDAKAKLAGVPLALLLGRMRERVPVYGSGGFTTYDDATLAAQFDGWRGEGVRACKMKIGVHDACDPSRVRVARDALGPDVELFVDANGAYAPRTALAFAESVADCAIRWFEEPVSSDDVEGLRFVREHVGARVDVAAGEYAYTPDDFRRLLERGAVDVLQADATRCGGISGFLAAAALADAHHVDVSAHCAPALHRHVGCVAPRMRHIEWFHDHVRIERMLFDGAPVLVDGALEIDTARPGLGLELRTADVAEFAM
ncbi:enolase C-terminal domain-like protein [Burkholderia multivorans]|uniref:enolase C-terminal domain-like protein n=1 Tax=Burkholderia multivorans TaxID=87883 RepID=UPI000D002FBE|nr:enolase C-terminal domain-like protein [Burkholderia multivorans]MBJ9616148.1 mandelate racemase [Burkholderia multivorans]MBU9567874.1 mandelate racemase [Burkholderia multivorans]MBU9690450.1 mandelate racemase [Burkholderia multivorans]MDR8787164.1 3,6-anhydro-alpha-L-galactonate cycloisomerase [Burkholderia multivorans]MDR8828550.1 3,6-anhydro-alpha-L-galactonate cycloisomerase [Burkholderia multivorans]